MEDIVERLRYQRTNSIICGEAANVIEKLRNENDSLRLAVSEQNRENRFLRLYESAMIEIGRLRATCGSDGERYDDHE